MSSPPERRFTEEQVSLILKRAAELQKAAARTGDSRRMSLSELEAVACEAGLDGAMVRRAAAEVSSRPHVRSRPSTFLGGPRNLVLEAVVEREVTKECYEEIVEEIRRGTGELGQTNTLGKSLAWASGQGPGQGMSRLIHVTVVPRGGRTTIRIEEKLSALAGALFGGVLGGVGGGGTGMVVAPLAVLGTPILIPLGLTAWIGGVYLITRRIYGRKARAREHELQHLLRRLIEICELAAAA